MKSRLLIVLLGITLGLSAKAAAFVYHHGSAGAITALREELSSWLRPDAAEEPMPETPPRKTP